MGVINHTIVCTSSIIMSFIRASCSADEGRVAYTAGRWWMLGVERVKHISFVGTVPILVEKGRICTVQDRQCCNLWQ